MLEGEDELLVDALNLLAGLGLQRVALGVGVVLLGICLLYTSDAADE